MAKRRVQGTGRREREERQSRRREREKRESLRREQDEKKRLAMVAREEESRGRNEAEKEKEKEGEDNKFGQQFFKVFFPNQSGERLRIPRLFNKYLQNQPIGAISLKGPSGNTWISELVSDSDGLFFAHGWKEFLKDHSIESGHFLTFRYDRCSLFSVAVFDSSGTEKLSAFHAKPCKDFIVKMESNDGNMDMNASPPSEMLSASLEERNGTTREVITEVNANDTTLKRFSDGVLEKGKENMPKASLSTHKAVSASLNMGIDAADLSQNVPLEKTNGIARNRAGANGSTLNKSSNVLEKGKQKMSEALVGTYEVASKSLNMDMNGAGPSKISVVPIDESNGTTKKRVREIDADGSTLKKFSNVSEKHTKELNGSSLDSSNNEDSDSLRSMLENRSSHNKHANSSSMLQGMRKNVSRRGKSIGSGNSPRQPAVISQRPPVTEEQKNYALQKAMQFKSKNPFVVQIMKESYVYVGFFMNIPCEFVRECLPRTCKKMTLWDPEGRTWEVNYVYYCERSVGAFSAGWGKFALGNHLEKFDVCVFELFMKDNIKVHIYRVVVETAPFLPGPSKNGQV